MCNLNECLEHTVSIKWSYPRSSAVAPIIEVSKVREAKNTTKSLKSLNSVITVLLQTIEKEVLIPILKTKTEKQLAQEIGERFDKFYELRRSLIAAFLSNFQDKDLERLLLLIKSKAEQHIDSFLETKASSIIGEDATLSIIFALDTNRKVNKSFLNLLKQDVVNEQWFEDKSKELYKLEFAKTFLDLCLCSLFLILEMKFPLRSREIRYGH